MATQGGWLTPVFLDRYILYKPPLAAILSGLSLKAFGISLLSLRIPALLAGALVAPLIFVWARRLRPDAALAGVAAALLLVSNRLWHVFSRVCQTDVLVAASVAGAIACFAFDTRLARRRALLGFSAATAAGILSKSVAGLIPLLVLIVAFFLLGKEERPAPARVFRAALLAGALAAPWHIYQIVVHPKWFWAEYIHLQLLGFGLRPPTQISGESNALFYVRRLFLTDPVLCLLALVSLPPLLIAVRRGKNPAAVVLLSWITVAAGVLLLFQFRNVQYVVLLVPALCLLAGAYFPFSSGKGRAVLVAALCLVLAIKVRYDERRWGLPHRETQPLAAARLLRDYAEKRRPNELILVAADDDFYAAVLPLPHVRYLLHDPENHVGKYAPYFEYLGVTVPARQFLDMEELRRTYGERLRDWGLPSIKSLATMVVARERSELADVIRARPEADFYVPADWRSFLGPADSTHDVVEARDRLFLLSRRVPADAPPSPRWTMPERW
jgi:hypothetical protein